MKNKMSRIFLALIATSMIHVQSIDVFASEEPLTSQDLIEDSLDSLKEEIVEETEDELLEDDPIEEIIEEDNIDEEIIEDEINEENDKKHEIEKEPVERVATNVVVYEVVEEVKVEIKEEVQPVVSNYNLYKYTRANDEQKKRYVKPDFKNMDAYGYKNPYTESWLGQCTWYTWGRFVEIYGYDPGFTGNGCDCVKQLILSHPHDWILSDKPVVGSVFSADFEHNHVGLIVGIEDDLYLVQEGNLNNRNDTIDEVDTDWWLQTYTMEELKDIYGNITFANPKKAPDPKKLRTDVVEVIPEKTVKKKVERKVKFNKNYR